MTAMANVRRMSAGEERIAALFTGPDGRFRFARWGRPLAPVVYGTNDEGIRIFEEALASVAALAGLPVQELDQELGANFLAFFCRDWEELTAVPQLPKLVPSLGGLIARLAKAGANQYRVFAFDGSGAIRICITLIRYDRDLRQVSAQTLSVSEALRGLLLWSDRAFESDTPIAVIGSGECIVKPWYRALIRTAYDPAIPAASREPALALRLAARVALAPEAMDV